MNHPRPLSLLSAFAILLIVACATPTQTQLSPSTAPSQPRARVLTMADRHEPNDMAQKIRAMGGSGRTKRLFNASLALIDTNGDLVPYLAEALPQPNSDAWKVFPDGRMETTYRLRPNLTWHDGQPLTAEDFVFAHRVYTTPALGVFSSTPQDKIAAVLAPDPRTLVIQWSAPYPDAGALTPDSLDPLPRHLLEPAFAMVEQDPSARDPFLNLPFWTTEYVGAGPYRLERWQQGVLLEGAAFEGHALGRPKIDRIVVRFMRDENTILANVLAGEVDFATRTTLRFNHGQTLEQEWVAAGRGRIFFDETAPLAPLVQFRPEYQRTPGLLDARVRKAMAHGIDKHGILDVLYDGKGSIADTFLSRREKYYPELDRAIAKYPLDPRQVERYMTAAGYTKDREGFFVDARGERFRPEYQVLTSVDYERVQLVVANSWRAAGIDVQTTVLAHELVRDDQARQTFAGMSMPGSGGVNERAQLPYLTSQQIGTPANRWKGSNRGGWSNAEYDRLFELYESTLERSERDRQVIRMMAILSEELPAFPLYYNIYVLAAATGLAGPEPGVPDSTDYANIHLWEWR